jgi:hypothetical protein
LTSIVFESGFSESSNRKRFDVDNLRTYNDEPDLEPSLIDSIEEQLAPFFYSSPGTPAAAQDPPEEEPATEENSGPEPPPKKLKLDDQPSDERLFTVVDVRDFE